MSWVVFSTAHEVHALVEEARRLHRLGSEASAAQLCAYFERKAVLLEKMVTDLPVPGEWLAEAREDLASARVLRDHYATQAAQAADAAERQWDEAG